MSRCRSHIESALARIDADAPLNAWTHVDTEEALLAADFSDALLAAGRPRSALEGQPVAIKANIAVAGWPHDGGLQIHRGVLATQDAPLVRRLRAAGAILIGQTSMDVAALGAEGRAANGPIRNPHRPSCSAGGSSGGSAAAIAAGHVQLAIGTDTIGSVRIPAAYCGISSLKPSAGRISRGGLLPVHPRFDHAGPMAKDSHDLEVLWSILAGESISLSDWGQSTRANPFQGRKVGYVRDLSSMNVTPAVSSAYTQALDSVAELGAELLPFDLTPLDPAKVRRAIFSLCEHAMWLTHRADLETQPKLFSPALTAMLRYGSTLDEPKRAELENRIDVFARQMHAMMEPLQALLVPTTSSQAFDFATPAPSEIADLTAIATAASLPAVSVPIPVGDDLPVGLQILTAPGEDVVACRLATAFARSRD